MRILPLLLLLPSVLSESSSFGHGMKDEFLLDDDYINLNHGSFGAVPKFVLNGQSEWVQETEIEQSNPDRFFRYTVYDAMKVVRAKLASYVNARVEDLVFIMNASEGMNALLRSLLQRELTSETSGQRKTVLSCDLEYFMVAETIRFLQDLGNVDSITLNTTTLFPVTSTDSFNEALIAMVEDRLEQQAVDVCVFSHITSMPSMILPVKDLTMKCHKYGALVLIDGAHALGQIPLDIPSIKADAYVSNAHKWLYSPKGSAFLWVSPQLQAPTEEYLSGYVYPVVISNEGEGDTPFTKLFSYEGTKDYSAFLSVAKALEWRESFGDKEMTTYMHDLAVRGGQLLKSMWNTQLLTPDEMYASMVMVEIPLRNCSMGGQFSRTLLLRYNTWVPIVEKSSKCWVRVSAQVYNDLSDFAYLGRSVLALLREQDTELDRFE